MDELLLLNALVQGHQDDDGEGPDEVDDEGLHQNRDGGGLNDGVAHVKGALVGAKDCKIEIPAQSGVQVGRLGREVNHSNQIEEHFPAVVWAGH